MHIVMTKWAKSTVSGAVFGIVLASLVIISPGCGLGLPNESGENTNDGTSGSDRPEDRIVTVRFKNFTLEEAVDVEFFATNFLISTLPEGLFQDNNRFTASVGIAGTGIVEPLSQDIIEYPCTDNLTLGTLGGRFVDNETGELQGIGHPRWAQQGPLSLCGSVVTFEYLRNGSEFITKLQVTN